MTRPDPADRLIATYRLFGRTADEAEELAAAIAREQTLEVPAGVAAPELEDRLLGRVESLEATEGGSFDVVISYDPEVTGTTLPQLVNVAYGNVSLMNGVRLIDLVLPRAALDALPGPRLGIEGLRAAVGARAGRPLVAVALKPVGRSTTELEELADLFVRAGVDVIKDDHGLVDQRFSPFDERVERVAAAVSEANAATGARTAYFPNVTGPVDTLPQRIERVSDARCAGVMLCPGLMGLDVMRALAHADRGLAVMAHPAHAESAPGRLEGVAPDVRFGTLYRAAGADVVVYVNAEGRFSWPVEECEAINARLRGPLGGLRTAMPAPAGGVDAGQADRWLGRYGPDTMLLIGGSLLAQDDVAAATRRLVEVAAAFAPDSARADTA